MANVSKTVVAAYLSPSVPLRAAVAVYDTIVIKATLTDMAGAPVDLTGCDVIITATDRNKTILYSAEILSASNGLIQAVVQPDLPGRYAITAKVSVPLMDNEHTFFLGSFSVAADGEGEPGQTIRSYTEEIEAAVALAQDVADDVSGYAASAASAKEDAEDAAESAAGSAQDASGYAEAASGSAGDAADSAEAAAGSASDASDYADAASGSAGDAADSAEAAAGSASAASDSADEAAGAAQAAINTLLAEASAGQVLVKTSSGHKWDYPCNASLVENDAW